MVKGPWAGGVYTLLSSGTVETGTRPIGRHETHMSLRGQIGGQILAHSQMNVLDRLRMKEWLKEPGADVLTNATEEIETKAEKLQQSSGERDI